MADGASLTADWCDSADNLTVTAVGKYNFTASRATYDSTYRFADFSAVGGTVTIRGVTVREVVVVVEEPTGEDDYPPGTPVPTDWPLVGVNLAGAEFGDKSAQGGYDDLYTYPLRADFERYANEGLKLIRLPFIHLRTMNADGTWTEDLARIKQSLDYAQEFGCKVILDPHDGAKNRWNNSQPYTIEELSNFLVPLADEVADHPALAAITLTNEPTGDNSDAWNIVAKGVILNLHAAHPNLTIVIPGASYSSVTRWWTANPLFPLDLPDTVDVVYEGHLYLDNDASGRWGDQTGQTTITRYQTVDPQQGVNMAKAWVNWLQHYGLKGFIGETGVPWDNSSALTALDNTLAYLGENQIPVTYWAAGRWWSLNDVNAIEKGGNFKEQMVILRKHVESKWLPVPYVPAPIVYGPSAGTPTDPVDPDPEPTPEGALPLAGMNIASTSDNPRFDAAGFPVNAGTAYRLPSADFNRWKAVVQPAIDAGKPWLARIGIAGERLIGNNNFGALDDEYMNIIINEINFIHSKGGKVILDLHNYCRWWKKVDSTTYNNFKGVKIMTSWNRYPEYGSVPTIWTPIGHSSCPISNDGVADMWRRVALRVKDLPGFFAYGTMNEPCPQDAENLGYDVQANWMNVMAQKIITAIRTVDTKNYITVCGNAYASAKGWKQYSDNMKNLRDSSNKLLYEAHQYNDANNSGGGKWANRTSPINIQTSLAGVTPFIDWLKANGKKGYLGEFGGPAEVPNQVEFLRQLQDLLIANGIPYTQWRGGGGMSDNDPLAINRADGSLTGQAIPLRDRITKVTTKGYGPY